MAAATAAAVSSTKESSSMSSSAADSGSDSLKAAIFQRLHPRVYLERFLAEDVRPDGRAIGCAVEGVGVKGEIWRDVSINVGMLFPFCLRHSLAFFLSCSIRHSFRLMDLLPELQYPTIVSSTAPWFLHLHLMFQRTRSNFLHPHQWLIHSSRHMPGTLRCAEQSRIRIK
jgi:hypothetical protein